MFKFDQFNSFGKDGFEALVASATAMTKGYQSIAQETVDYSRKSLEKGQEAAQKAFATQSVEKAFEVQQGYAKESFDAFVGQASKVGEMYMAAVKEAYKPFESNLAAFGFKFPK
jgi:phasin family protein